MLSATVLGPGDKQRVHDEAEEDARLEGTGKLGDINSMVLMPPHLPHQVRAQRARAGCLRLAAKA